MRIVVMLAMVLNATAGDLDGWGGQPWGSTTGGPKDPAAASLFAPGQGEVGNLFLMRSWPGKTFLQTPVTNPIAFFLEGELCGVVFTLPSGGAEVINSLTSALGDPLVATGGRYFQQGSVSVSVEPVGGGWLVNLVSVPHRARCVSLFGAVCQMAATRDEVAARLSAVPTDAQATWNALAEERRLIQEKALAQQQASQQLAADQAAKMRAEKLAQQREGMVRLLQTQCSPAPPHLETTCATYRKMLADFDAAVPR